MTRILIERHLIEDRKAWEKSETRINLYQQIEPLLLDKTIFSIYQVMTTEEKYFS